GAERQAAGRAAARDDPGRRAEGRRTKVRPSFRTRRRARMVSRRTTYGWMAAGGLLCLLGLALACKVRDGNRAHANSEPGLKPTPEPAPTAPVPVAPVPAPAPPPPAPAMEQTAPEPRLLPPIAEERRDPEVKPAVV